MKLLIFLITISISIFAKSVIIETSGTYTQLKFAKSSPIPDETSYARQQALMFAKQSAVEEAGTTLYVSFTSTTRSNGNNKSKNQVKAIASALIKTKVLSEGWNANKYIVKIRATIDSKDAEDVFKKSDKRLKEISALQKKNEQLLADIKKISNKIFSIGKNGSTTTNTLAIHKMNSKQKAQYFDQVKLLDEYEENVLLMRTQFENGSLLDLANEQEIQSNKELEKAIKAFDNIFTQHYKKNYIAKLFNIKVKKHGNKADVEFLILQGTKEHSHKNYFRGLHHWFSRKTKQWYAQPHLGEEREFLLFKNTDTAERLKEWIIKNRTFALRVKLGNRYYYTDNVAEYKESTTESSNGVKFHKNVYEYFINEDGMMMEMRMKDIPLSELADTDSMEIELVYNKIGMKGRRIGNNYPLPMVREAKEYYNGIR